MIEKYSFGTIGVNGMSYNTDIKIVQGLVIADWWRASGHTLDVDDIRDILEIKPKILVIGKGEPGYMKLTGTLLEYLEKNNIELIEERTSQAIHTYNRLFEEGKNVSGGFHLGC